MKKMPKVFKAYRKAALQQGWAVKDTTKGMQFVPPDGGTIVTVHCTPNPGKRSLDNCRADLRRSGLELP